ncbi:MAG: hypothetical protein ACOH1E_10945 [Brevundimonas sp.]
MLTAITRFIGTVSALSLVGFGTIEFQTSELPARPVLIANATGQTILRFYAWSPDVHVSGDDLLGAGVLANGDETRIDVENGSGGCIYYFRVELADGSSLEGRPVNVCQITQYRYGPLGLAPIEDGLQGNIPGAYESP